MLLRHGESTWNKENRFTGWTDVDLSREGRRRGARGAGSSSKADGYDFDVAYTSVLKRAIRTLWIVLDEMDLMWIPVHHSWRLNERHYGALQGLNKAETAAKYGEEQVKIWRRSYDIPPPALDRRRRALARPRPALPRPRAGASCPLTECLKDTVARFLPYWHETIAPASGRASSVLIAAHGNSLRALVKYPRQHLRRRHRRAEHSDRHAAGLRARREPQADHALLPRRPGRNPQGPARSRQTGEGARGTRTGKVEVRIMVSRMFVAWLLVASAGCPPRIRRRRKRPSGMSPS